MSLSGSMGAVSNLYEIGDLLIGVSGKAGSGKNAVADIICELVPTAGQYAFADPLKEMALAIDPLVYTYSNEYERVTYPVNLTQVVSSHGWDGAKQFPGVRRFLQRLGTEGVRETFGDDAWVDLLHTRWYASDDQVGVVTDVRFPNELDAVDVSVRIERGETLSGELAEHASEQVLKTDFVITNNSTFDDLRTDVIELLVALGVPVDPHVRFAAL